MRLEYKEGNAWLPSGWDDIKDVDDPNRNARDYRMVDDRGNVTATYPAGTQDIVAHYPWSVTREAFDKLSAEAWENRAQRDVKEKECEGLRLTNSRQQEIVNSYWKEIELLKKEKAAAIHDRNTWRDVADKVTKERDYYQSDCERERNSRIAISKTADELRNENARLAAKLRGIKMIIKAETVRVDE